MNKVSIIIPTRNRANFLERAVKHAFAQDYQNLEVIVSNNASTDNTRETLESLVLYYPALKIIHHKRLFKLSSHWNKVIKQVATGDYILLIPDDDIITDVSYLTKAINLFIKYDSLGLVFANYFIVNQDFKRVEQIEAKFDEFISKEYLFANYNTELFGIKGIGVSHLTTVFSKKVYIDVGGFNLECMCPDTYLWLKILLKYDAGFVHDKVAEYLVHDGNLSRNGSLSQIYSDTLIAKNVGKYAVLINENRPFVKKTINRMDQIFYKRFHKALISNIFNQNLSLKYIFRIKISYLFKSLSNRYLR